MKGKKNREPDRDFILERQLKMLHCALACWPRRAAPLLSVNCGDGKYLKTLWQSGFDIVATEGDADLRKAAIGRDIPGLEVVAAFADDVPFEDDCFDWVVVHLRAKDSAGVKAALGEACRVARRGFLVTFWNTFSLAGIFHNLGDDSKDPPLSWFQVWRAMQTLAAGRLTGMGSLCGPRFSWRGNCPLAFLNGTVSTLPLGAWCAIRLDLSHASTGTPLALRLEKQREEPEPAMGYSKKFTEHSAIP